jgi:hypothetical protein
MPERGKPLRKLGFLTIGRFDEADPGPGHEQTLSMIERAEALGFDSVCCGAGTCSLASPPPSRSWQPPASAPAGSNWARR